MESNLTTNAQLALGEQLYQEACSHFEAFCVDKEVLEGVDDVTALLLSLGVDLPEVPKSLTLPDLF